MNLKLASLGIAALNLSLAVPFATAQTATVDHFTQAQLAEKAQALSGAAQSTGAASTKLSDYPNHYTMIALRNKSGGAEIHEAFADFFFVLHGHATLVTGGSIVDPKSAGTGEIRGTSVQGGSQQAMGPGDVAHIPAGVPHQLLMADGTAFSYFVIKVREK